LKYDKPSPLSYGFRRASYGATHAEAARIAGLPPGNTRNPCSPFPRNPASEFPGVNPATLASGGAADAPGGPREPAILAAYGSAYRLGAWPPPNSFGKFGAMKQLASAGSGGCSFFGPPLGMQSKFGKIPCLADEYPASELGCG
jgi:hypothetical protein